MNILFKTATYAIIASAACRRVTFTRNTAFRAIIKFRSAGPSLLMGHHHDKLHPIITGMATCRMFHHRKERHREANDPSKKNQVFVHFKLYTNIYCPGKLPLASTRAVGAGMYELHDRRGMLHDIFKSVLTNAKQL
eukprot:scaffold52993_cov32-Prasinocladus_malaysianus.AAC.2